MRMIHTSISQNVIYDKVNHSVNLQPWILERLMYIIIINVKNWKIIYIQTMAILRMSAYPPYLGMLDSRM